MARYGASIKAQTNPWDELCLTICETINNAQLKCKAVIDVAKRAIPPWSQQLNEMVKLMLNAANIDKTLYAFMGRFEFFFLESTNCANNATSRILVRFSWLIKFRWTSVTTSITSTCCEELSIICSVALKSRSVRNLKMLFS